MGTLDDVRRLRVASLYLRGLLPMEIQAALRQGGIHCELEQVCDDIAYLMAVWAVEVSVKREQYKARLLAELREARRAAWAAGKFDLVLKALDQERELLDDVSVATVEMLRLG